MKLTAWFICALLVVGCVSQRRDGSWLILETTEAGRPVIVSARKEVPGPDIRRQFPWATTIEWYYPAVGRGMPSDELLKNMYAFEREIESRVVATQLSMHALTRTGNGLREWTYYVIDRRVAEDQMAELAKASPAETISVKVHQEPDWTALQNVLSNIRETE
jgi:hypothetical protein